MVIWRVELRSTSLALIVAPPAEEKRALIVYPKDTFDVVLSEEVLKYQRIEDGFREYTVVNYSVVRFDRFTYKGT